MVRLNTWEKKNIRDTLVKVARAQTKPYPQYKGHFRGYMLGKLGQDVKTKLGFAGTKGQIVIFKDRKREPKGRVFWSVINDSDILVSKGKVRKLM